MPADLDDLFTTLGRQADAVPLGPATDARDRGVRRRRNRALLAGAAAVLVAGGAGVAVWRSNPAPRPVPAAPPGTVRAMVEVGSPIKHGGKDKDTTWTQTVIGDGRLYAAKETQGVDSTIVAIDLKTAKKLWESAPFHPFYDYAGPIAVPGALLVSDTETLNKISVLHVLDPATGRTRWKLPWRTSDEIVTGDGVLARMVGATGVIEAFDLRTGGVLWSAPAGPDRPVRIVGLQSGNYDEVGNLIGPRTTLSDDGLVQITRGGQVVLRDIRSGTERTTGQTGRAGNVTAVAHEGELFTLYRAGGPEEIEIRVTDLTGGASRVVYTGGTDNIGAGKFAPCGPKRLCVGQFDGRQNKSMVMSIDTKTGEQRWTAGLRTQLNGDLLTRGSRVLRGDFAETALFDAKGRTVYAGVGEGRWIDDQNVLWKERSGETGSTVSVVAAGSGWKKKLGSLPGRTGNCSLTSEFLACPVATMNPFRPEMRIWRFTR